MRFKIIITALLVFLITINIYAQGFAKLRKDTTINGHKFYKGELLAFVGKNNFMYGQETYSLTKHIFEKDTTIKDTILNRKFDILKRIDSLHFQINVTQYLNKRDTIKLIKKENSIVPFVTKGIDTVDISECDDLFRLIIPGKPSIIYDKYEILNSLEFKPKQIHQSWLKNFITHLSWWHYVLFGILLIIVVFLAYWLIAIRRIFAKKEPSLVKFSGDSLETFARNNNISVKRLIGYNKELRNFNELDPRSKDKTLKSLRNQNVALKVGYIQITKSNSRVKEIKQRPEIYKVEPTFNDFEKNKDFSALSEQLRNMESKLLNRIAESSSNKDMIQKVEILQKETESLKEKLIQSNKEKDSLSGEKNSLRIELDNVQQQKQKSDTEFNRLSEKVVLVEFLEPHARVTLDYFLFIETGIQKAFELYYKVSESDVKNADFISQLLVKFQSSVPVNVGKWKEIASVIINTKAITNAELITSFKQLQNNEEKLKEFKRVLFIEVLEKYASSSLILAEELSKLSKFTGSSGGVVSDFEHYFKKHTEELQTKIKVLGLDLNYVPLFENYEKYAAYTKLANQNCSLPYKHVHNLNKDSVLEIIKYGFGNEETKVILI